VLGLEAAVKLDVKVQARQMQAIGSSIADDARKGRCCDARKGR
jgi:hypothetical protein